jgi:transposase
MNSVSTTTPTTPADPTTPVRRTSLGIDIAKRSFDAVVLLPNGKPRHRKFENNLAGFQALVAWLQQLGVPQFHACMEATGRYWEALATFLYDQGHAVSVVNPKRIAHFAKSRLARAKTDKVDAGLIAHFCEQEQPGLWSPSAPMYRDLQALLRRRVSLEQIQQQEQNRLGAGIHPAWVEQSLRQHLEYLAGQLQELEEAIRAHLAAHPELQAQRDLLLTIPGIGETTARWLLAELGDVKRFRGARQAAAYAGLDPRLQESGTWKGKSRLSKQGNALLRKALYLPAVASLRWNPIIQAFAARLRERGKSAMAVVGAAMRKLVHLAYGVLHQERAFDPAWQR